MKKLQIFGTGCPKCQKLTETAEAAAHELGIEYELEKVQDLNEMLACGVIVTPALAIDGELKTSGKIPDLEEVKKLLA